MPQYSRQVKHGLRWFYKFDLAGKTYKSKCKYLSKIEAKREENALYEELCQNGNITSIKPILSLAEAIDNRLDEVKAKKSAKYYLENRKQYFDFLKTNGDLPVNEITKADINSYLLSKSASMLKSGKDNYSVNATLRILKALFNHAITNSDLNIKNPCLGISLFPINKKMKYIPSDKEIKAVLELCDDGQKNLIDFVMITGCRISEALKLLVVDVYDDYVILYTRKSKNSDLVPRKVSRPKSLDVIGLRPQERPFRRWSETPRFLEDKIRELGLRKWSWHNLRHRYASLLSKSNTPIFEISARLGHSSIKTTQIYLQMLS